jgi:hypothetical protein
MPARQGKAAARSARDRAIPVFVHAMALRRAKLRAAFSDRLAAARQNLRCRTVPRQDVGLAETRSFAANSFDY